MKLALALLVAVLLLLARAAHADEGAKALPEPYTLQVVGADAAALGTLGLSYAAYEGASYRSKDAAVKLGAIGMLGYMFVAPGIHMAHQRPFVGILDLGLRIAPLGLGLALEGKGNATQSAAVFGTMGAVSAFDALVLARPGREGERGGPDWAVMGAGAATFGLSYGMWRAEVAELCRGSACPRALLGVPVVGPAAQTVRLVTADGFTSCPWKEIGASACFLYPFVAAGAVVFYAGQAVLQLGGAGLVALGAVAPWKKKKTETTIGGLPVTMRLSVVGAGAGLAGEF